MKKTSLAVLFLGLLGLAAAVPASAGTLYSNGPGNYGLDAWAINYGYSVTDSFTLSQASTIAKATFDIWVAPGDTLSSVVWSIGTSQFGGTQTTASTTGSFVETNASGYNIYTESFSIPNLSLAAGSYWFTLQGAVAPGGSAIYWDENDGPSAGYSNAVGSIGAYDAANGYGTGLSGSETFALTATPEPSSFLLFGSGLVGLACLLGRKHSPSFGAVSFFPVRKSEQ